MATINLSKLPAAIPGFPDYNPKQQVIFSTWLSQLERTCKSYGFTSLTIPLFVRKEFLRAKSGNDTEIYSISRLSRDPEEDDLFTTFALPFDNTVPLALWIRDNAKDITFPYKRYAVSPVFRGENPSPGRFRGFYQCDIDIVGPNLSIENDIQCLLALVKGLQGITSEPFTVFINDMSITKALLTLYGVEEDNFKECLSIIDRLDKDGSYKVIAALSPFTNQKEKLVQTLLCKGDISNFEIPMEIKQEIEPTITSLNLVIDTLMKLGITCIKFSPSIVRGLNYYTGIVFETFLDNYNAGSIMSGGRYNNLVDTLSSRKSTGIMGVGGAIGVSRIFDIFSRNKLFINDRAKTTAEVIVLYRDISYNPWAVAEDIRNITSVDIYTGNATNISKQLDYANKLGISIAVIIMDTSVYCVKNLYTKEQIEVTTIPRLLDVIKNYK
jgi:histidyl-tRNA synthetase